MGADGRERVVSAWAARTVSVRQLVEGADDTFGNPTHSYSEPVEVSGVLVAPSDEESVADDGRPHAVVDTIDLYVPSSAPAIEWRGAQVDVDGGGRFDFDVDGDARRWPVPHGFPRNTVVRAVRRRG